jgi:hypothetical protein
MGFIGQPNIYLLNRCDWLKNNIILDLSTIVTRSIFSFSVTSEPA